MGSVSKYGLYALLFLAGGIAAFYYFTPKEVPTTHVKAVYAQNQNLSIPWALEWSGLRVIYEIPVDQAQNPQGLFVDIEIPQSVIDWLKAYVDANNITKNLEETLVPQVYYYTDYDNSQSLVKFGIYSCYEYKNICIPNKLIVSNLNLKGKDAYKEYNHYVIVYYPLLWFDNFEKYQIGQVTGNLSTWKIQGTAEIVYADNDKVFRCYASGESAQTHAYKLLHIPISANWSALYLITKLWHIGDVATACRITVWFKTKDKKIIGISYMYRQDGETIDHSDFNNLGTICHTFIKSVPNNPTVFKEPLLANLASYCGITLNDIVEIYGISISCSSTKYYGYPGVLYYGNINIGYVGLTVEQK